MRKILLIDDDPATTDMLGIQLQGLPCEVIAANSGEDGVRLARIENPDLIILDLMLLDMDGLDLCTQLRKFTQVPVMILSAVYTPSTVAKALDCGADDYLSKPAPSSVLFARINSLMRRNTRQEVDLLTASASA